MSDKPKLTQYHAHDRMRTLINDNGSILFVMSRFGIPLGFGDKSVGEICVERGIDTNTFLSVANFVSGNDNDISHLSLTSLMEYHKRAHTWFLDFNVPDIRRKLIEAIDCSGKDEVALLILKFYDEYVAEVRAHMEYENSTVFTYVEGLQQGILSKEYDIANFAAKHNHIDQKLADLKNVIVRYYPQGDDGYLLHSVLFDIINCENDLALHCAVEDKLFVPAVEELESRVRASGQGRYSEGESSWESTQPDQLSQREREIIGCIAKGMTSKDIADRLCISVHTVTTHRRNITTKLQIHTQAGLTIYAIVHKLVSLSEIKMQ